MPYEVEEASSSVLVIVITSEGEFVISACSAIEKVQVEASNVNQEILSMVGEKDSVSV